MLHNGLHMTLAIILLNNIFPLHTKTQKYHLKSPNVTPNALTLNAIM